MKTILSIAFFVLLFYFNFANALSDKIVAVVNEDVIVKSELDKKISQMRRQKNNSKEAELRKKSLDELIDILLQLQLAKKGGIKINDSEINQIVANIAKSNGLTIEQLKQDLPKKEGINYNEFRMKLREQGLIARVQQQILGRDIEISNKDINNELRKLSKESKYHVLDVLFEEPEKSSKSQIKKIKSLAKKMIPELKKSDNIDNLVEKAKENLKGQVVLESVGETGVGFVYGNNEARVLVDKVTGDIIHYSKVKLLWKE